MEVEALCWRRAKAAGILQRLRARATEINYGKSRYMCMKAGRGARSDGFRTNGQQESAVGRERATSRGEREERVQRGQTGELLYRTKRVAC